MTIAMDCAIRRICAPARPFSSPEPCHKLTHYPRTAMGQFDK
jgi:hypothetical protein